MYRVICKDLSLCKVHEYGEACFDTLEMAIQYVLLENSMSPEDFVQVSQEESERWEMDYPEEIWEERNRIIKEELYKHRKVSGEHEEYIIREEKECSKCKFYEYCM